MGIAVLVVDVSTASTVNELQVEKIRGDELPGKATLKKCNDSSLLSAASRRG
jgi:hypothetical protein